MTSFRCGLSLSKSCAKPARMRCAASRCGLSLSKKRAKPARMRCAASRCGLSLSKKRAKPARMRYATSRCGLSLSKSCAKPARMRYATSRCGLSPTKIAKINAHASKLAGRYFHSFAWLVAYPKYLLSSPSNAFPWRASSRAISCTVS